MCTVDGDERVVSLLGRNSGQQWLNNCLKYNYLDSLAMEKILWQSRSNLLIAKCLAMCSCRGLVLSLSAGNVDTSLIVHIYIFFAA